jgi:hypothetical protein
MNIQLVSLLGLLSLLAACTGGDKPGEKRKSPWDDQIKVMEQSKQVDQMVEDNAQKQREEMEKQGL